MEEDLEILEYKYPLIIKNNSGHRSYFLFPNYLIDPLKIKKVRINDRLYEVTWYQSSTLIRRTFISNGSDEKRVAEEFYRPHFWTGYVECPEFKAPISLETLKEAGVQFFVPKSLIEFEQLT